MKTWFVQLWSDPAKFVALMRSLGAAALVGVGHWAGAPAWVLALAPSLALLLNAGEKNPPESAPKP